MEITPVHTLSLCGVLSESKRIYRANQWHFLGLSLLFFPLAFSFIISPAPRLSLTHPDVFSGKLFTVDHSPEFPLNHQNTQIFCILYILLVYVISICAIATITYSTYRGFSGEPVNFSSALKSLTFSFFPIVSTAIVAHVLIFLISLSFLLFVGSIINLGQNLGFVIDYNSIYFMLFSAVIGLTLALIIIYFHVNWSLAFAIAVAESKWGVSPLMRSSYLVRGMKSVSVSLLLLFGILGALWVYLYPVNEVRHGWSHWGFIFHSVAGSSMLVLLLLNNTATNTVLYMYCKALHGELAIEIAEDDEFAHRYISLPMDDEKVPHIVTVVAA